MAVSIQDVARKAGVTIGTVSRAMHDYPDIKQETKERVMAAARELGYKPNISARNLASKRPPNIALIVSGLMEDNSKDNLVFRMLQGILTYTNEHMLELALHTTDSAGQRRMRYTEFCDKHSITGAILSGIAVDDAYGTELLESGIPAVLIDMAIRTPTVGWVSIDNRAAAREAVGTLLASGHREVVIMAGKRNAEVNTVRLNGTRDAFAQAGRTLAEDRILYGSFDEQTAYLVMKDHLARCSVKPDGIFCFSDIMALGVMRAVKEAGLRIPEDVSIIGFDGLNLGELTTPRLATVVQDMRAIGYAAAGELHRMMNHEQEGRHCVLPYTLDLRESFRARK